MYLNFKVSSIFQILFYLIIFVISFGSSAILPFDSKINEINFKTNLIPKINLKNYNLNSKPSRHLKERCFAGRIYRITSTSDLFTQISDLECIFRSALVPIKVPEGPMFGEVQQIANARWLNPLIRALWTGKLIQKITCLDKPIYLGWNRVISDAIGPFIASLGSISDSQHLKNPNPIYIDDKPSIILDYTNDVSEVCPDFPAVIERSLPTITIKRSPYKKNFLPIDLCVDVVRPVGMQSDGGVIYLGKMFLKDIFRSDNLANPIAFFSVVNYDQEVVPGLKSGDSLKPLETDIYYRNQNFWNLLLLVLPFDNFLSEPIHAMKSTVKEIYVSGRNFGHTFYDFFAGIGSSDRIEINKAFISEDPDQNPINKTSLYLSKQEEIHSHYNEL